MAITKTPGRTPYISGDNTRDWVEALGRVDGKLKPALVVRWATDTNYIRNAAIDLYTRGQASEKSKSLMNLATPCMQVPGILNWNVQEGSDGIVQSATMELLNCLLVSEIETTIATGSDLAGGHHSRAADDYYVSNSIGVVDKLSGMCTNYPTEPAINTPARNRTDFAGYHYDEDNVKYRTYHSQSFRISANVFPDPRIPTGDVDNDTGSSLPTSSTGVGSYFLRLTDGFDEEIVRVHSRSSDGRTLFIQPGGRSIQDRSVKTPRSWPAGTRVQLLNFGPFTGERVGVGYMNIDDLTPQTCLLRPGTCLTSYEGWGEIKAPLTHYQSVGNTWDMGDHVIPNTLNYEFTGYWFVSGLEPSLGDDGVPKVRVDLKSVGYVLDKQKITPDLLRRAKTQFGQWRLGESNSTIWGAAGATRNIPGDWVDYDSWDPSLPSSYPLRIKTEIAQHQEFYDHMTSTDFGNKCELCKAEHAEWLKTHEGGGAKAYLEARAVGKHIYKSSIRVLRESAGPIKTYIRLMGTIAAAAWDHPAYGTELAQNFSKFPNELFSNIMLQKPTGLIFNGQVSLSQSAGNQNNPTYDWFNPSYTDLDIVSIREALVCPYEATYDKAPFSQPMQELAEANGNSFWLSRKGQPVFVPRNFNFRPEGKGGEWHQSYGASISQYSNSVNADAIITQCWVTATSAFKSSIMVPGGGTVWDGKKLVNCSGLGGNTQGLALTSGVQQVETISLDNQVLGLSWDTNPAAWGAQEVFADGTTRTINAKPALYDGSHSVQKSNASKAPVRTKRIKETIRFFMVRNYILPLDGGGKKVPVLDIDSKWDEDTTTALKSLQTFVGVSSDGVYGRATYTAINSWLNANQHYVKFDIWWYAQNSRPWEEYLSAITGVPVKLGKGSIGGNGNGDQVYAISNKGTQKEVGEWTKTFSKTVVNVANRIVDDSINKATVRSLASNMADPRIQPGDVIWASVPGFTKTTTKPPFTNGIYVTNISRSMDLMGGTYTATYSGYRYIGNNKQGLRGGDIDAGYNTHNVWPDWY